MCVLTHTQIPKERKAMSDNPVRWWWNNLVECTLYVKNTGLAEWPLQFYVWKGF